MHPATRSLGDMLYLKSRPDFLAHMVRLLTIWTIHTRPLRCRGPDAGVRPYVLYMVDGLHQSTRASIVPLRFASGLFFDCCSWTRGFNIHSTQFNRHLTNLVSEADINQIRFERFVYFIQSSASNLVAPSFSVRCYVHTSVVRTALINKPGGTVPRTHVVPTLSTT